MKLLSIVFHAPGWQGEPTAGDDAATLEWRPVDVVESDEFAWHIPGLADKLRGLLVRAGEPSPEEPS